MLRHTRHHVEVSVSHSIIGGVRRPCQAFGGGRFSLAVGASLILFSPSPRSRALLFGRGQTSFFTVYCA